jgi:hypothetical protein
MEDQERRRENLTSMQKSGHKINPEVNQSQERLMSECEFGNSIRPSSQCLHRQLVLAVISHRSVDAVQVVVSVGAARE